MSWGTALLISLGWIVGTIVIYIIADRLDKVLHFQDHKGWSDLGRWIINAFITVVPPICFLLATFLIKLKAFSNVAFFAAIAMIVLSLPAFCLGIMILNPPNRMAAYCMAKTEDYEKFRENYLAEFRVRLRRNDVTEHEVIANYIEYQLNRIPKKLKFAFKYTSLDKKTAYINAVMKCNQDRFHEIIGWEIVENSDNSLWLEKFLLIDYDDGDISQLSVYYKLSHDKRLANYSTRVNKELLSRRKM